MVSGVCVNIPSVLETPLQTLSGFTEMYITHKGRCQTHSEKVTLEILLRVQFSLCIIFKDYDTLQQKLREIMRKGFNFSKASISLISR